MKQIFIRILSIIAILSVVSSSTLSMALSDYANGGIVIQASQYISSCSALITAQSGSIMAVDCAVTGTGIMDTIGVKTLKIQKYQSGTWTTVKTWSNLYNYNCLQGSVSSTYQGVSGSQYRAVITFYSANSNGSDTRTMTTTGKVAAN